MSYNSLQSLSLFFNTLSICLIWLMHLHFASTWLQMFSSNLHHFINILLLSTAVIFKHHTSWGVHWNLSSWSFWMISAICQLVQLEWMGALSTREDMQISPDLPIYLLPWYTIGLSNKSNKLLEIPFLINGMLSFHSSLSINECSTLRACEKFTLASCK